MTDQANVDAIIIGAGHNGLICANYLAKAGKSVLVLEAKETVGGAACTREFAPGFKVSAGAQWLYQLNPNVVSDLKLLAHGLEYAAQDLESIALNPNGKQHIIIHGSHAGGGDLSEHDAHQFAALQGQLLRFVNVLDRVFNRRPPKLIESDWHDKLTLARLGLDMKMLGKEDMSEMLRVGLINIYDLLDEYIDNPLLKGALSVDAVLGSHMGPRSPNTVFTYLYRLLGQHYRFNGPALLKGGMGQLADALLSSAQHAGVEVRTNCAVKKVNLNADSAQSVTLCNGETISAKSIVSNADPKTTFTKLVGLRHIEGGFSRRVQVMRMNGNAAKLHLALDGLPGFSGLSEHQTGARLLIAPDMKYVERAFNHAKYGELSSAPAIDISIPTAHDSSLAAIGQHVLCATVQYAPYDLKGGWNDEQTKQAQNLAIDTIAQYAPRIKEQIVSAEYLSPVDLEQEFNTYGGHWHHGEISLDQVLMMRPTPGCTQYRTPVDNLYLCGAGAHPGGGLMGLAGKNAAEEILRG
ncbi:MAG: NAD(P)/FAD-dependent oxidoreductase [Pseudomonadota bacterium]